MKMPKLGYGTKQRKGASFIICILPASDDPALQALRLAICPAFPDDVPVFIPVQGTLEGHLMPWFTSGFT